MPLKMPPFTSTRLEEERMLDKGRVITMRLNEEESAILERMKNLFDTPSDGTAIKLCWFRGWKCITDTFSDEDLRWLSRLDRSRLNVPKELMGGR